jgi:A/G-specific adenine glycosylase
VRELLEWLQENGRIFPWRETTDARKVYAAELLLQRTKVDAVQNVFLKFIERYLSVDSLDGADEDELRKVVYELGLVDHRVKTLISVGEEFSDGLPSSVDELKEPWDVGKYSARACQLFTRGDPQPLVDSNFARAISRVMKIQMPSQLYKTSRYILLWTRSRPETLQWPVRLIWPSLTSVRRFARPPTLIVVSAR